LRYPRPVRLINYQGTEFMDEDFQALLWQWGIRDTLKGVQNPQANAFCERLHQVVGNILQTTLHTNPPQNKANASAMVDYSLQLAVYAMRTTVHRTLGIAPRSLVFHRDMIMDLPFVSDLFLLRNKRQELIDYNLRRENYKRRSFDYQPGHYQIQLRWEFVRKVLIKLNMFIATELWQFGGPRTLLTDSILGKSGPCFSWPMRGISKVRRNLIKEGGVRLPEVFPWGSGYLQLWSLPLDGITIWLLIPLASSALSSWKGRVHEPRDSMPSLWVLRAWSLRPMIACGFFATLC
jgi:hypothetical protein